MKSYDIIKKNIFEVTQMEKIINFKNKTLDFIYKYRFIIAIVLIIIGVLFKLHGSSINLWNTIFTTGVQDNSLLFGTPRTIRSDEWAVTTPFIFSQRFNNFGSVSYTHLRAHETDS